MAIVDLVMPKLGESITEAIVLKWTKKIGDNVKTDETLVEIATDKVDSEVPSTVDGTLSEILYRENDVVPIGTVIARIETGDAIPNEDDDVQVIAEKNTPADPLDDEEPEPEYIPYVPSSVKANTAANNRFYSPLVLNIAASEGVPLAELEHIPGTGNDGRVTKKDILQYVADKKAGKQPAVATAAAPAQPQPEPIPQPVTAKQPERQEPKPEPQAELPAEPAAVYTNPTGNIEIVEMDRTRKMIAKHMVTSKQVSPHVTSFSEADVTNMVMWRNRVKEQFEKSEGTRITFMPMFIACLTRVIKRYPYVNCSVEGDRIILKKDINIGMATALPSGSLIVPVIKNADYLNLVGLSKSVNSLAESARSNRLRPDDTANGTFTITNVGTFGSLAGTPIINQPQVAILAVGAIKKRPVVIETAEGDTIGIRHMMYLSLSYDHRVVDGSIGASFLTEVAKEFEKWDVNQRW